MSRFARGLLLVKASWRVLMGDRELMLFTLFGGLCTLATAAVFIIPFQALERVQPASLATATQPFSLDELLLLFAFMLLTSFITIFFNTALATAVLLRMRGEAAGLEEGFGVAFQNIDRIFLYALISATVGLVLSQLERQKLIGRLVGGVLGTAWSVLTFLVVPVMVAEGCGPLSAIVRSGGLLRKTWGEQLSGDTGIGLVFSLLGLVAVAPLVYGFTDPSPATRAIAIGIAAAYLALLALVSSTLGQIFRVAVYVYATTGAPPDAFTAEELGGAFRSDVSP